MIIEYPDEYFNKEELENTQGRHKRFLEEWKTKSEFNFTIFDNPGYNQMIMLRNIEFASLCSHHLLPFYGIAHIAYIPNGKICGISKLARTVDKFASRPQIQERMTEQIADFIEDKLNPKGLMVVIKGVHQCMRIRGVRKQNAEMVTSAIRGVFDKPEVRQEFLHLLEV